MALRLLIFHVKGVAIKLKSLHIKGRLLKQAGFSLVELVFEVGTPFKGKNLLPKGANSFH